jgi:hypothetical protein
MYCLGIELSNEHPIVTLPQPWKVLRSTPTYWSVVLYLNQFLGSGKKFKEATTSASEIKLYH